MNMMKINRKVMNLIHQKKIQLKKIIANVDKQFAFAFVLKLKIKK